MNDFLDRHKDYLKYLLLLSLISFVILFVATTAHGAWYDLNWQYRKQITIKGSEVTGGPHGSFPVLIQLASDADLAADAQSNGDDILFTSSDETTKIPHEIESFNGSTGALVAWVKVDLSANPANTIIYMYYGYASATNQQNAANVWSDYKGVWHLNEVVSDEAITGTHYDSTSNNNHGTQNNNNDTTGKIARGQDFDGSNDYISVPSNASLQPTTVVTLSGWIKLRTFGSVDEVDPIIRKGEDNNNNYELIVDDSKAQLVLDGGDGETILGTTTLSANSWYYIVGTWQSGGQRTVYLNGSPDGSPGAFTGPIGTDTRAFYMGGRSGSDLSDSTLDEVRISKTYRTAQWIQTEYNNQSDPANFVIIGSATPGGGSNNPPNVDAGSDQDVTLPNLATLDGTADSGGDGPTTPPNVEWTKTSGPGTVTFGDQYAQDTTASFSTNGTYVLRLTADDGADTAYHEVTITVHPAGGTPIDASDVAGYSCNMKITIDNTKVAFTSENFPVLISLTDDSLKTSGCGFVTDPDGDDIVFTNSNLTLQLNHEIEKYDAATGELVAWVLVPALSGSTDTDIYMYYGDSNVTTPQENPTAVWDSNYVGVWHLDDTSGDTQDSTSYNTDGVVSGTVTRGATGKIEDAFNFGTNGEVDWGDPGDGHLDFGTGEMTLSLWVNMDNHRGVWEQIILKGKSSWESGYQIEVNSSSNVFYFTINEQSGDYEWGRSASIPFSLDTWTHVVGVVDRTNNLVRGYKDGVQVDTGDISLIGSIDVADNLTIGRDTWGWPDALIEEVRLSNTARSAEWIQTSYNNQNSPSSFYSVEKNCPTTIPPIAEFTCSIPLTIDSSKVSGTDDLIDFPVLISLTNTSLKTTGSCGYVQNSNGYDIIFSDATQTTVLDHEIEKYDSASGELVAWVKVPALSATSDTTIYIHYGHGSVCGATENPTAVWDSNYTTVWHLKETSGGTGAIKDSTANVNHGTDFNSPTFGVTGKIGKAIDFDGTNDYATMPTSGFNTSAGTVEVWANMDTFPATGTEYIFSHKTDPTANRTYIFLKPGGIWGTGMGDTYDLVNGSVLSADTWYHLTITWDGTYVRGYKDGVLNFGPTSYSGLTTVGNIYISAWDGTSEWLDGTVDEVRLSNTARSADWIQTEYNNQSNPSSFYSVGASSCFLSGFSCNRRITIDSTKVAGSSDLTNFPFLLKIQNDCNIKTAANGGSVQNSSGWDIIFIDSDGVTQLDHEIEDYDGTTGDLTAWVRVPTLPYNSDKDIYMYYGKSGLTCDPSNATGVWDSNYEAVYHLNDDFEDSTSHNRDATAEDTDNYASVIADGENFGPQDEIAIGNWNFSGDELTLQTWARFDDFDQDDTRVFSKANATGEQGHVFMLGLGGTGENYLRMRIKTGTDDLTGTTTTVDTDDPLSTGTWYLIAGTYDGANMRLLSNGVEVHSAAKTGNLRVNSWNIALGNHPGNTSTTYTSMDGKLDEVRILSVVRSANWLRTEYNNQDAPDSFYSMSQDTCGGTYGFNFQYCKKITVDYTQVNSELYDFPLLINIANDDDLKTVANGGRIQHSQGWDIVFRTKGCGNLDHEIEKYDGANGNLVAWVSIPVLYADTDTEIYMYYGASNVICSPENPDGVWDSSYVGVWHLDETVSDESTAGTHYDSTSNDNDGSQTNNDDYTNGKIGTGQMFDGNGDYIYTTNSFNNPQNFTVSAWFKTSTASGKRVVGFESDQSGTNSGSWDRHIYVGTDGKVYFGAYSGSTDVAVSTNTLNDDTWHYAVGVRDDGADYIRLYIDGSLNNSTYNSNAENYSGWWRIGSYKSSGWPSGQDGFLPGVIDEVRISNTVRSAAWIQTSYNNQNNPNFYSVTSCFEQTQEVTQEWVEEVQ